MSQWRRNDDVRHMRMKLIEKGNGMAGVEFGLREEKELLIYHSRKEKKQKTTNSVYVGRQAPMVRMSIVSFLDASLILVI